MRILLVQLLFLAGWGILVVGVISSISLADSLSTRKYGADDGMFLAVATLGSAFSVFAALLTWTAAYVVKILSEIEMLLAEEGGIE